jgi:hypothetical protein
LTAFSRCIIVALFVNVGGASKGADLNFEGPMSDDIVQEAYSRVRSRYREEVWLSLPPRQITEALYQEIRAIDAERLQAAAEAVVHHGTVA